MVPKKQDAPAALDFILLIFRYRWWFLTFVFAALAGATLHHLTFPSYKAITTIHVQPPQNNSVAMAASQMIGMQMQGMTADDFTVKYHKLLESQGFAIFAKNKIKDNLRIRSLLETSLDSTVAADDEDLADHLLGMTQFRKSDQDLIDVIVRSPNRANAVEFVNFVGGVALNYITDFESKELEDAEKYLNSQLGDSQVEITDINKQIGAFKDKQDTVNLAAGETVSFLNAHLYKLQEEMEMVQIKLKENNLVINKMVEAVRGTKLAENEVVDLNSEFFEGRGRVVDRIKDLKDEREVLLAKQRALEENVKKLVAKIKPQYEQKIYEFKKKLDGEHNLFQELRRQIFEIKIMKISVANRVRLFDQATLKNSTREESLVKKLLVSMVVSTFIFSLLLFVWDYYNPRLRVRADLSNLGVNYLGSVPDLVKESYFRRRRNVNLRKSKSIVCDFDSINPGAVAFKYIRTRLSQIMQKKKSGQAMVISITSANSDEGKSVVALNLAIAFGRFYKKTLLVDGDFIKNSITRYLNLDEAPGLYEHLRNGTHLNDLIQMGVHDVFSYLPAGTPSLQSDVLREDTLSEFYEKIRKLYDIVIIDTPAFSALPDGLVLSQMSDLHIVVAKAHTTRISDLQEVRENLDLLNDQGTYGILNFDNSYGGGMANYRYGSSKVVKKIHGNSEDTVAAAKRRMNEKV